MAVVGKSCVMARLWVPGAGWRRRRLMGENLGMILLKSKGCWVVCRGHLSTRLATQVEEVMLAVAVTSTARSMDASRLYVVAAWLSLRCLVLAMLLWMAVVRLIPRVPGMGLLRLMRLVEGAFASVYRLAPHWNATPWLHQWPGGQSEQPALLFRPRLAPTVPGEQGTGALAPNSQ